MTPDEREALIKEALIDATAHLVGMASAYKMYARRHYTIGLVGPDPFYTTRQKDFDAAAKRAQANLEKLFPRKTVDERDM